MTTEEHSPSSVWEPSRDSSCRMLIVTGTLVGGLGRSWGVSESGCERERDRRSARGFFSSMPVGTTKTHATAQR